ncbi:unnamed protein product [Auanema sp. JU1783]|nr:unnamed protein product [Auanema sp. JU1783]
MQCFTYILLLIKLSAGGVPLVITTWGAQGFQDATERALKLVNAGRLNALVEGLSICEEEQCDGTVGYGGSPDENGDVFLDAMLIDGPEHRVASVAHLPNIKDAARVAWAIMNYTEHTMLVGQAARNFAVKMGFKKEIVRTNISDALYTNWMANNCQPNFWKNVTPDPNLFCGPYTAIRSNLDDKMSRRMKEKKQKIDNYHHDTIGMVVVDEESVSAGTSTNGATHKIPGRVGDSPIVGAGAYAVHRIGGAAATGDGDIMMRFLPSYQAVEFMRNGHSPRYAAKKSLDRILEYYPTFQGAIVVASMNGKYGAACANLPRFDYCIGKASHVVVNSVLCDMRDY